MSDDTIVISGGDNTTVTVAAVAATSVTQPNDSPGTVVVQASSLTSPPPAGVNPFLSLTDTPVTYTGYANYIVAVNSTEDGLIFIVPPSGGGGGGITDAANDSNYYFRHGLAWSIAATVAHTGAYGDLSGTPTLAPVATSGAYADLSGLPTLGSAAAQASSAFAATVHTHAASDITSGTLANARIAASNVTQHQAALAIDWSQLTGTIPAIAVTSTTVVASQAAQLALTAQEGDLAVRSDLPATYIKNSGTSGTMSDWTLLQTPTDAVGSVFGRTGVVIAQSGDYTFAQIGSKPTTLAGYGITDAVALIASPTFTGTPAAPTATAGTNTTQLATTAFVAALGALKANLASPTFTGIPAGPTAAPSTNTTQFATTAFVEAVRVILAAADALKAPLASAALTGVPTAPTAAVGTNTTQLATMAAIQAAVSAIVLNSQSVAYTAVLADAGKALLHPAADTTARTFTIPDNATVAYPIGTLLTFINQNAAGVVTIAITTDTMRLAGAGTTGSRTLAANGIATATKIASTEWIITGTGLT